MYNQADTRNQNKCKIVVTNVKSGDCLCYSLVLLKGYAQRNTCSDNNNDVDVIRVCSRAGNKTGQETEWPVVRSQFKCVVSLLRGRNDIALKYGDLREDLVLEFLPRRTAYRVMPVYIVCSGHDGRFQAPQGEDCSVDSACKRIALGARLIQCVTAEKLHEAGFSRKTFQLEADLNSQAAECIVFHSRLHVDAARTMAPGELWQYFGRELMSSRLGSTDRKFLAFVSCTRYVESEERPRSHEEMLAQVEAHVALGGGGLAVFGTACLHTWPRDITEVLPRFSDTTAVDSRRFMDDSCFRGTYGGCFATTLGSVCHELGHTFDLGHSENGIMGRGFDNINQVFVLLPTRNEKAGRSSGEANKNTGHHATVQFTKMLDVSYRIRSRTDTQARDDGSKVSRLVKSATSHSNTKETNTCGLLESDMTYWGTNCATLLAFHRWFNTEVPQNGSPEISYDDVRHAVVTDAGLVVVELRDNSGLVLRSWQFPHTPRTTTFNVPVAVSQLVSLLVAQDASGNILKKIVHP